MSCSVYFGMEFNPDFPVINDDPDIKIFHTGVNRYFVFNKKLSLLKNIQNLYYHHTYEFLVKISSSTYMEILDSASKPINIDN